MTLNVVKKSRHDKTKKHIDFINGCTEPKDTIKDRRRIKHKCECGSTYCKDGKKTTRKIQKTYGLFNNIKKIP